MKARFEVLKKMRAGKTSKRKIYSDSTLRNVNQLSLSANVACMSGGGIGQLCNAIPLDEKKDEVIIMAGNNEITRSSTPEEFVYTVEKAGDKLKELAGESKVTLVLPTTPATGAIEIGKARYLEEKMTQIQEITTVKLEPITFEGNHPSLEGAMEIIKGMQKTISNEIVLDGAEDTDITTKRTYSKVQPIYKVGCRGCKSLQYTNDLCQDCVQSASAMDTQYLKDMIQKIQDELFPIMIQTQEDIEINMREITKRGREDPNEESVPAKQSK